MKSKIKASPQQSNPFDGLELPEGWTLTKVRDLVTINYGKGLKEADRAGGSVSVYGSNGIVGSHNKALTNGPSIIIGRKGSIGEVHYSANSSWPIDTTYYIDKFEGIDQTFLVFALKLLNLSNLDTSTAIPGLNRDDIYDQVIPFPPLTEQQHIVARVEALMSHVNAAIYRLSRVPLIMKKFRQVILVVACSGGLTEGWREKNPDVEPGAVLLDNISVKRANKKVDHLKKVQPLNDEVGNLPDNWTWTQIGFITESMKNGVYKEPKYYKDDGFPCLRMYNIEDGKIIWKNIKHMDLTEDEIRTYLLQQNDILINRVNSRELVGKSALITEKIEPCVYESKNIRLRMYNHEINSQYVIYWLQVNAQKFFNLNAQQTVGMASINQDQIASMPIPLPPLAEQHEIVRRVGAIFERADAISRDVVTATKRTEALTQAVLGKAFRGELVPAGMAEGQA